MLSGEEVPASIRVRWELENRIDDLNGDMTCNTCVCKVVLRCQTRRRARGRASEAGIRPKIVLRLGHR